MVFSTPELVRAEILLRLKNTDYTQLPDSPLSAEKKEEYATYRQALRDFKWQTPTDTLPEPPAP